MESEGVFYSEQQEDPIRNAIKNKNVIRDGVVITEEDIDNDIINNMRFLVILEHCESIINRLDKLYPAMQKIMAFIDNDYNMPKKSILKKPTGDRFTYIKSVQRKRRRF